MSERIGSGVHIAPNPNPLYVAPNSSRKPAEDYKASHTILSGQELMQQMGGAPTSDVVIFGKTIKTNSTAYKSALAHLQNYQSALDAIKDRRLESVPQKVIDTLKRELQGVVDAADKYEAKHADQKEGRRNVMASLRQTAVAEMANLGDLGKLQNTSGKINIVEGMALLRGGVTDVSGYSPNLNDSLIDPLRSKDNFGSGKANSVSLIAYGNDMRVLKPLHKEAEKLMAGESATGFDQNDMRTAARNIASAKVAEKLGIRTYAAEAGCGAPQRRGRTRHAARQGRVADPQIRNARHGSWRNQPV